MRGRNEWTCDGCGTRYENMPNGETRRVLGESQERACEDAAVRDVVAWLRRLPPRTREDWGLNATEEIADLLESNWRASTSAPPESKP